MKKIIGLFIFVLLTSCGRDNASFSIVNECFADTDTVFIQYINLDNNVTYDIHLNRLIGAKIFETKTVDGKLNWDTDYRIKINSIKNVAGDTLNFDPNNQYNWTESQNSTSYIFQLKINNASFQ